MRTTGVPAGSGSAPRCRQPGTAVAAARARSGMQRARKPGEGSTAAAASLTIRFVRPPSPFLEITMNARALPRALAVLAVGLAAPAAFAQPPSGKQPVTHEALWMMKRVGSPAVSPDGRWLVVPVTEPA